MSTAGTWRTPPPLVALVREADALLTRADLRRSDVRWLRGELVDVMLSPVGEVPVDEGARILLTLVPRHEVGAPLADLVVEVTDEEGQVASSCMGADGQVLLRVATPSYRVRVRVPSDLVPTAVSAGAEATALRGAKPGHGPRSSKGRRRATLLVGAPVLVVAAILAGLVLPGARPAVAVVEISDRCGELPRQKRPDHVVVAAVWSGKEKQRFTKVLQQFTKKTGIHVTFATTTPRADRDIGGTLAGLSQGGCAPDVALLPQPGLLRKLARDGLLQPVDASTAALVEKGYAPAWKELGSFGSDLYGVWFKASDKSTIWYSTEAFARAGVAPPTTWQELKDAAARLVAAGITPFAIGGQDGWTLTDWFENVYLRTAGLAQYKQLAAHQIPWTDPSVTTALRTLAEIFEHSDWIAGGPRGAQDTSYEDAVRLVFGQPRQAAMIFAGDFAANEIATTSSTVGKDARVFSFPSIRVGSDSTVVGQANRTGGGAAAGGDVAVLLKAATEGGKKLLRYLASPEAAEPWVRDGGFSSPNRGVDLALYRDDVDRRSAENLVSADVSFDLSDLQPPSFGSTPREGMGELLRDFLTRPDQVEAIAAQLEAARTAAGP